MTKPLHIDAQAADVGEDAVGPIERLARVVGIDQHLAGRERVRPVQTAQGPAIEARERIDQVAQALGGREAVVGPLRGRLIKEAGRLLAVIDRRRPQEFEQAGTLAVLAVMHEDDVIAALVDLRGDPALHFFQAQQVQAANSLVQPAEGPLGQRQWPEGKDIVLSAVRPQIAEVVLRGRQRVDVELMTRGKAPGHLMQSPLAAAGWEVMVDRQFHISPLIPVIRAGVPIAIIQGGTDLVTTAPAPITAPRPIVTPASTTTFAPIHTSSSTTIGA